LTQTLIFFKLHFYDFELKSLFEKNK